METKKQETPKQAKKQVKVVLRQLEKLETTSVCRGNCS